MNQLKKVFQNHRINSQTNYIMADYDVFVGNQGEYTRFSLDAEDMTQLNIVVDHIKN